MADDNAAGRQDGVEDEAAFLADLAAVGIGEFVNEAVRAQQAEFSAAGGRAAALFLLIFRGSSSCPLAVGARPAI